MCPSLSDDSKIIIIVLFFIMVELFVMKNILTYDSCVMIGSYPVCFTPSGDVRSIDDHFSPHEARVLMMNIGMRESIPFLKKYKITHTFIIRWICTLVTGTIYLPSPVAEIVSTLEDILFDGETRHVLGFMEPTSSLITIIISSIYVLILPTLVCRMAHLFFVPWADDKEKVVMKLKALEKDIAYIYQAIEERKEKERE